MSRCSGWGLDGIEPPAGVTLLGHVERWLPASGVGPLPDRAQLLPDDPPSDPAKLRWAGGAHDALISPPDEQGTDNEPLAAAAAISDLLLSEPDGPGVRVMIDRLEGISGPAAMNRLIEALEDDRGVDRVGLAELGRWLCRNATTRAAAKGPWTCWA